ncbi:MAG: Rne/Rng family ribonuclease [Microcystaceae cyanobacterium]
MPKQIIIAEQHQIAAVFWDDQIQELVVATGNQQVGDIYLGIVENVIPGIDAAFVNIGDAERNGFIHVTDLGPLRLKRSAGAITELLTPQQKVLVQVMKEPTGNKGPRLTGNISLPGRYLVLMPHGRGVNLSRRIRNEDERSRLRALAILVKPAGMGLLVRTEAEGKSEEAIIEDLEFLQKQWESIQQQANATRPPALLNRDDDFIQRVLRDMYSADVNRIVVDFPNAVKRVKQHLIGWGDGKAPAGVLIDHHREHQQILDYFRVNAAVREALKPRVDLPSGGYIIIEPTEALTVIDVNSGSFTRSATARETVLWTNSEAATEIARQLRLRNIGGVIIVDFIDMDSRRDQLKLLEHFNKALKSDKARPQISQLSELGLVELTRKRQGQNIYELFGQSCPTCGGLGHLANLPGEGASVTLEAPMVATPPPITPPVTVTPPPVPEPEPFPLSESYTDVEAEDETALDLLHHPSYQEQGGSNNARRRRRRRVPDGVKEETPTPSKTASTTNGNAPVTEERERKERPYRNYRQEEAPKEQISVEMTPLEQDIYALMGISPIVRLDEPIKDPKSVIVSVKTPNGEKKEVTPTPSLAENPSPTQVVEVPKTVIDLSTDTPVQEIVESPSEGNLELGIPLEEQVEESKAEIVEAETNNPEQDFPVVRRRRRSSVKMAQEAEAKRVSEAEIVEGETPTPFVENEEDLVMEEKQDDHNGSEDEEDNDLPVVRRRRRRSSARSS